MRKSLIFWTVISLVIISFFSPQASNAQKKPIVIGFPMILSGGGALFGEPSAKGAEMIVKEINDKGGLLGRPVKLVVRDCGGSPEEATRVARDPFPKQRR